MPATLSRRLSLTQATAINMIDMVGIGPFVVMTGATGMVSLTQGPGCLLAWLIGALLAFCDGAIWAELGAKWPEAGGSYVFLQKLFPGKAGRLMAFLYILQTTIQAPLVMASAAIGFSNYFAYLLPLEDWQKKALSCGLVLAMIFLLYRNIQSIGKLSVLLWIITGGTMLWLIFSGLPHVSMSNILPLHLPENASKWVLFVVLGQVSAKAVYSYLGYYNVCHLGAEISNPKQNIPRAIFISITGITLLYLAMQTVIVGVVPWQDIAKSDFVVSLFFERLYSPLIAKIATGLVLIIALSSLFSVMLGYSRVPYAAAKDGLFFPAFARIHPRHKIPHISLLVLGGLGAAFALLFKMKEVISAIVVVRILIQFLSQAVGVVLWRRRAATAERSYRMWLYPVPVIISIALWLFLFITSDWYFILGAIGLILLGIVLFFSIRWPAVRAQEEARDSQFDFTR